jgi:hypothetical protein
MRFYRLARADWLADEKGCIWAGLKCWLQRLHSPKVPAKSPIRGTLISQTVDAVERKCGSFSEGLPGPMKARFYKLLIFAIAARTIARAGPCRDE